MKIKRKRQLGRKKPTLREQLASALLHIPGMILDQEREGSAREIAAVVEWHHNIPVANGGSNAPQNLGPLRKKDHAHETRTKTVPMLSKGKRLRQRQREHADAMLPKAGLTPAPQEIKPAWEAKFHKMGAAGARATGATENTERDVGVPYAEQAAPLLAEDLRKTTRDESVVAKDPSVIRVDGNPKAKRKLQGRGFQGSRTFDGRVRWKDRTQKETAKETAKAKAKE